MKQPFVDNLLNILECSEYLKNAESILIFSDFGGEHKKAKYYTFSFLLCDSASLCDFESSSATIRSQFGINSKAEFGYKHLKKDKIINSLPSFLGATDGIKGSLVTIAIDKEIPSLWHTTGGRSSRWELAIQLEKLGLGKWKPNIAEKLLLVCHLLSGLIVKNASQARKLLWLSDNDAINENGNNHTFDDTKDIFLHVFEQYSSKTYDLIGFSRSLDNCLYNDLLSLPDLAAGRLQDLLTASFFGIQKGVSSEQLLISNWLATCKQTLDKQSFVYRKRATKGVAWELGQINIGIAN